MKKRLGNCHKTYGELGEDTGCVHDGQKIYVGDLFVYKHHGRVVKGVVVKADGHYRMMGNVSTRISNLDIIIRVISYKYITDDITLILHGLNIEEIIEKKMTKEEIEKALGYSIEIVEGGN